MKQLSLRLDEELHNTLAAEAKFLNKSLSQHIIDTLEQRGKLGHVYTTNFQMKRQVRFNLTFLGDLLVMGHHNSFNGLYDLMEETIKNGDTVVIQRHYENSLPSVIGTIETLAGLQEWKKKITSI